MGRGSCFGRTKAKSSQEGISVFWQRLLKKAARVPDQQWAFAPLARDAETTAAFPERDEQQQLFTHIAQFIERHNLTVTGQNLSLVCDGISGANPHLHDEIIKRELVAQKVDQEWLDSFAYQQDDANERMAQMEELMDLIEKSISRFRVTTKNARDATGAYTAAVSQELETPTVVDGAASEPQVGRLLDLSRAMLGQLKTVEAEVDRSQKEAEQLRANLAKARKEAVQDHLTGLPNRRAFERTLEAEIKRMEATGIPLSVAFCDIDHFKLINDTHGHEAGDRVLKAISKALSEIAGDGCFVARHGGEEFALLFKGLSKEEAFQRLDKTRIRFAHRRLSNRANGQPFGKITFSAGVAQVNDYDNPRTALAQADDALYRAKSDGRNRVARA